MVTVDHEREVTVERLFIDVPRWEALDLDVSCRDTLADVSAAVGQRLESLLDEDSHVPRAVRVTVTGASPAHGELFGLEGHLRANVLARIAAIDNDKLWLEKVRIETTAPTTLTAEAGRADAIADFGELLREADQDPELAKQLRDILMPLWQKAPELLPHVPALDAVRNGDVSAVLKDVGPALLARLAQAR